MTIRQPSRTWRQNLTRGIALAALAGASAAPMHAQQQVCQPGLGGTLFSGGASYRAAVLQGNPAAAFTTDIFFDNKNLFIGTSRNVGATRCLGKVTAGEELRFRIFVQDTVDTFYSGPAARNPDSEVHALVQCVDERTTQFGFEDIFGGGDRNYTDVVFQAFTVPTQLSIQPADPGRPVVIPQGQQHSGAPGSHAREPQVATDIVPGRT